MGEVLDVPSFRGTLFNSLRKVRAIVEIQPESCLVQSRNQARREKRETTTKDERDEKNIFIELFVLTLNISAGPRATASVAESAGGRTLLCGESVFTTADRSL